ADRLRLRSRRSLAGRPRERRRMGTAGTAAHSILGVVSKMAGRRESRGGPGGIVGGGMARKVTLTLDEETIQRLESVSERLCGSRPLQRRLDEFLSVGEPILLPAAALYEWLRGPRNQQELFTQELFFPSEKAVPFGHVEAAIAAQLYRSVRSPRSREIDLAI